MTQIVTVLTIAMVFKGLNVQIARFHRVGGGLVSETNVPVQELWHNGRGTYGRDSTVYKYNKFYQMVAFFFRSLSFWTGDHHLALRKTGSSYYFNKRNYSKFLFHGSIDEHVIEMAKPCVWAM